MSVAIGSYTLPNPSEESIDMETVGTTFELANGTYVHDNILGGSYRLSTLTWKAISFAVMDDIRSAFESLYTANRSYTDIRSDVYNVTAKSRDSLKVVTIGRSTPVYNVTIKLREIP